jgi:hypothetical protein
MGFPSQYTDKDLPSSTVFRNPSRESQEEYKVTENVYQTLSDFIGQYWTFGQKYEHALRPKRRN